MSQLTCFFISACLALSGIITGCSPATGPGIDIIQIEGVPWACNLTSSYATFGSTIEFEGKNKVSLAASEGDLLYMNMDDLELYYRYSSKDGPNLNVTFDTLYAVSAYLNGSLNYMELSGPSSLKAFEELPDPQKSQLSTLHIRDPLNDELISIFEEHESQMEGLSLVLESGTASPELSYLLSICRPEFLVLGESWSLPKPEGINVLDGLELLWIQGVVPELSKVASCCGDLESLIISGWEPLPGELLPLSSLKKLQNLTLAESDVTSLQNIEFPESLLSLNLIDCDTLGDIARLGNLPGLRRLNLTACDKVNNVPILRNLESLRWVSFPANITQAELNELAGSLNQVEVAELIGCTEISDLAPLGQMEHLHILALDLQKEQLKDLGLLKQLEMLILTDELFEDNHEWVKELRTSLPQCNIVPGSGMCLGSGWLLLLLPLVYFFRFMFRKKT